MEFVHKSIMLEEVIESLAIKPNGIYVDGTLGGAGHSSEIAKRLGPEGRLIGIDQDGEAIAAATKRLEPYKDRVTIVRSNYAQMCQVLKELGISKVDGILLDLGVSSYQLDNAERGFTYREDVPSLFGGVTITIFSTPATFAGTIFISTEDGYAAFPPGTYTPTEAKAVIF